MQNMQNNMLNLQAALYVLYAYIQLIAKYDRVLVTETQIKDKTYQLSKSLAHPQGDSWSCVAAGQQAEGLLQQAEGAWQHCSLHLMDQSCSVSQ